MARRGRHTLVVAAALLLMVVAAATLPGAGPAGAGDLPAGRSPLAGEGLSREVPDATIFYLQFSGFAPLREPFKSTALHAIWQEPEVQALLAQPLADLKGRIEAGTSSWPLLWPEVCDLLEGPVAVAVFPTGEEGAEPAFVLVAQPKDADRFRSALAKLVDSARAGKLEQLFEGAGPRPYEEAPPEARNTVCAANLKEIGLALVLYQADKGGELPPSLTDLSPEYLPDKAVLQCPEAKPRSAYVYVPGLKPANVENPRLCIVAFDGKGNHEGGRSVLFLDGHVEFLSEEAFGQRVAAQPNADAITKLDAGQAPQPAPEPAPAQPPAPPQPAPAAKAAPAPAAPPASYTVGSVTVTPVTDDPDSPAYCFVDGLFLLGGERGHLDAYLKWRSASSRAPLSSVKAYTDMEAKLQPAAGATLVAYLNIPAVLQAAGSDTTAEDKASLTALGVDRLDWLGVTVTCDPPGWRTRLFLAWHGEPTGLFGLLPTTTAPQDLLVSAPKAAVMAAALNLNAAEFYDRLRALVRAVNEDSGAAFDEAMASFAADVGFDLREGLLAPLGHEFLLYAMRTPLSPFGFDAALVVRGTDEKKLGPTLELLVAYFRKEVEAEGEGKVQASDVNGHALYSVTSAGAPIAPSFAVLPNYAVLSLSPAGARAAITAVTAAPPQPELSLSASDTFKAVREKLPANGAFLSYVDAGAGFEALYPFAVSMLTMFGQQLPFDLSLLPQPPTISKHLGGSLAIVSVEAQGLRSESYSAVVLPVGFAPVSPALGAAMLLPALSRARGEARTAVCRSNLKQIGLALAIYANDYEDKYPPALKDLMPNYVTDEGLLHCPEDSSDNPSYLYVPGLSVAGAPDVMVVIERKGIHAGRRNVLFVDGHVESLPEASFQVRWIGQQEKLKLPSLKELGDTVEEAR